MTGLKTVHKVHRRSENDTSLNSCVYDLGHIHACIYTYVYIHIIIVEISMYVYVYDVFVYVYVCIHVMCGGLNKNIHDRLMYLNAWSTLSRTA